MPEREEKSGLERLEERLYKPGARFDFEKQRSSLGPSHLKTRADWEIEEPLAREPISAEKKMSFLKKLFIISFLFFLGAGAFAAYFYLGGVNQVSSDSININVSGPSTVKGGEELNLAILLSNSNNISLESTELIVEFPDGTREVDNQSKELPRLRESIGVIRPNEVVNKSVKAILFGEENSEKEIKMSLEYRTAGSNAIFVKEKVYKIALSSSPVSLNFSLPEEVISNQELVMQVKVLSNALSPIKNALLDIKYPPGFNFKSAEPKPFFLDHVWKLGDLSPGKSKNIKISGILEGEENEIKSFKVSAGSASAKDEGAIAVPLGTTFRTLSIRRPYLSALLSLDGKEEGDLVARRGESLAGQISLTNNLAETIRDMEINLNFSGRLLDRQSVKVKEGFFSSDKNVINWNQTTLPSLAELAPGETVVLDFSFRSEDYGRESGVNAREAQLELGLEARGTRVTRGAGVSKIETSLNKKVKFSTLLDLEIKASAVSLPKAEKETIYNVSWKAINSSNNLTGAQIKTALPAYVRYGGNFSPQTENFLYNDTTRELVWNIGDIKAGAGYNLSAPEITFQLVLLPSLTQVGSSVALTGETQFTATDLFTNSLEKSIRRELITEEVVSK